MTAKSRKALAAAPAPAQEAPEQKVEYVNGNMFTDTAELISFVTSDEGTGTYDIPKELMDDYQRALDTLLTRQSVILAYLRSTGQYVPWPLQNQEEVAAAKQIAASANRARDLLALPPLGSGNGTQAAS